MAERILSAFALEALQGCVELGDLADVIAMQAIMNTLAPAAGDYFSSSTAFSERCLEHFCLVYSCAPTRSALALCRLLACQAFDRSPPGGFARVDPSVALRPLLITSETARANYELVQLRRATVARL